MSCISPCDYDDQKSCEVRTVLQIAHERDRGKCNPENQNKEPPLAQRPLIEAAWLDVPQNGLLSFYVAGGTPINDLVKQWKRH
jgi:hypothetical protein